MHWTEGDAPAGAAVAREVQGAARPAAPAVARPADRGDGDRMRSLAAGRSGGPEVNPSPGRRRHVEALHGFAVKQHAGGAEVLLEALEGDRGGQHPGPDSRLGGVLIAHAAGNTGDRSTILGVALPPWQTDPDHTAGDLMPDDRDARRPRRPSRRAPPAAPRGHSLPRELRLRRRASRRRGARPVPGRGDRGRDEALPRAEATHRARIFLCDLHARLEAAEPLTAAGRAKLARRRAKAAYWAEVSARQRAAHGMTSW
jgi:hypothetical protein